MITKLQFKETEYFKSHTDEQKTVLLEMLKRVNQEDLLADIKADFTSSIWDKESAINGIKAEYWTKDLSEDAQVYLIYYKENVSYVQNYKPYVQGNIEMSLEEANKLRKEHVNRLANDLLMHKVIEAVDELVYF